MSKNILFGMNRKVIIINQQAIKFDKLCIYLILFPEFKECLR